MLHGNFGEDIVINFWAFDHPRWNFRKVLVSDFLSVISSPFHLMGFFPESWKRRKARKGGKLVELLTRSVVVLSYLRETQSRSHTRAFFLPTDVATKPKQFHLFSLFKTNLLFSMLTKKTFHKPELFLSLVTRVVSSRIRLTFALACFKLPEVYPQDTLKSKRELKSSLVSITSLLNTT